MAACDFQAFKLKPIPRAGKSGNTLQQTVKFSVNRRKRWSSLDVDTTWGILLKDSLSSSIPRCIFQFQYAGKLGSQVGKQAENFRVVGTPKENTVHRLAIWIWPHSTICRSLPAGKRKLRITFLLHAPISGKSGQQRHNGRTANCNI